MKKTFCAGLVLSSLLCVAASAAQAKQWAAWLIPASLNKDRTIRVVSGRTQMLSLALQGSQQVKSRGGAHDVTLQLDLPPGMKVSHNQGVYELLKSETSTQDNGRGRYVCTVRVENKDMAGALGKRPNSEWKTQSLFVDVPGTIDPQQAYVTLTLRDGEDAEQWRWAVALSELTPAAQRPKRAVLGLWSYALGRAGTASEGIGTLLADAGVGFIQYAPQGAFREAMKAHGIVTGGNTHHGLFYSAAARDENAAGKPIAGDYPDPQEIIELPQEASIPGVAALVENARQGDGIATFDYEPRGTTGFAPAATARFQKEYSVSDADFKTFRDYVAKHGSKSFQVKDPTIARIWKQWTAFRSAQVEGYMRRIHQAFKAKYPQGKLAVTPSGSVGPDSASTLALGCDNSAMASFTDIIMPQLYDGYGGADAKLAMLQTEQWRARLTAQQAGTKLWPILLVRYAGASVFNTPARVRQQMLGALAHGADGLLLYYPGMMDAPYWQMLARANEEISKYEDFYLDGQPVEKDFALQNMPEGSAQVIRWPGYKTTVANPQWAFTAHRLKNRTLLTLFNLQEANDLVFQIKDGDLQVLQQENVVPMQAGQWLVHPQDVGFVVLRVKDAVD